MTGRFHRPVLLKEAIDLLAIKPGGEYIDATIGGGGHAQAVLKSGGRLLGIDCDPEAIKAAREYLTSACPSTSWRLVRGNFRDLKVIAQNNGFDKVEGILFDLGVSSYQLETRKRGFSFNLGGPLDMRMDPSLRVTAADLVNSLNKSELEELFRKFADEDDSGRLAEAIVRTRNLKPIKTGKQLAEIVVAARLRRRKFDRTHPATRVFQALRIAVNDELNNLNLALTVAVDLLRPGGRLVAISFHSGEDRIVKWFLREKEKEGSLKILTNKPVRPNFAEIKENPRSRSAKLRAAEKLPT